MQIKSSNKPKITVLRNERIIRCTETNKPVPILSLFQQNGNGVKRRSHHSGTLVGNQIGITNHHHIPKLPKNQVLRLHILRKLQPFGIRSIQIKMQHVVIPRVIHCLKQPLHARNIPFRTPYRVRETRQLR